MDSITRSIEKKLKLRINSEKSAVGDPGKRKFLGFSFTGGRDPNRIKIAETSIKDFGPESVKLHDGIKDEVC